MRARLIACFCCAGAILAVQTPIFEEVSRKTGINFRHEPSPTPKKHLPETMGGGVGLIDIDNDGDIDIFFTNGARISEASGPPDKTDPKYWNRLYRNDGGWKFTDVTERSRVAGIQTGYGMGVAVGDYDNDGFADLYLTAYNGNALYRNQGDGTFADVTAKAGVAASGWSTSAGFLDFDNDGKLDLFVCRYIDWTFDSDIYCGEKQPGYRAYCHPDNYKGQTNILFRNNGDGTFRDVSQTAGIGGESGKGLGVAFADYDGDGWTDVYVANDSMMSFLFRNRGDGTFEEIALKAGAGFNDDGKPFAGMGVDFADYDNDMLPDVVVTALSQEMYALFRNLGDGYFQYATRQSGVGHATLPYSGWSTKFVDYDNDGWKDLFVAQGHVLDTIHLTAPNLQYLQPPLLLRNHKGSFTRIPPDAAGSAFQAARPGRGAAFGDLDNDGFVDVVISNIGQSPSILRNAGDKRNHWLGLRLEGSKANRDAIGARIKVSTPSGRPQMYEVQTAVGYLSASDRRVIVGLGADTVASNVEIRWPGGRVQKLTKVQADRSIVVREPLN
jgi:hypothetical protein